jgi:dolichyl-phosphate beta-glucosyltransferase
MDARNAARGRDQPVTSLIFPTYNPGRLIERTCREVRRFLNSADGEWEAIFVCDGCTDGTPTRLAEWADVAPRSIRIVSYPENRGKGYAVRHGLAVATGAWRIFTDVDLAYGFEDIQRIADVLKRGAAVAIASRTHPESQVILPAALQGYVYRRHLQSLAFSALVRALLPLRQRDTQAGLKGLSADAARLVLSRLSCNGFGFDCELLTACVRHGLEITEVPVQVRYEDRASTTGIGSMTRMIRDLWRIRRAWRSVPPLSVPSVWPEQRRAA